MGKLIDLTGKRFNKLLVVGRTHINSRTPWKCICDCGQEKIVDSGHLRNGHTNSCGCLQKSFGNSRVSWKGCGEIPMSHFTRIKKNAKNRNIPFNLTIEYVWNLFLQQNKKCALSGMLLDFTHGRIENRHNGTASLDRIDNTKGYIRKNVQWIHKDINFMKQEYSMERFLSLCNQISEHQKQKPSK